MLTAQDLVDNFSNVVDIGSGVFRSELRTSKFHYFYLCLANGAAHQDLLVASQEKFDDQFAKKVFGCVGVLRPATGLLKIPAASNIYGFSSIVVVPPSYHSYFEGILDAKRTNLALCIPVFECEFSGREKAGQFSKMLWRTVPIADWSRKMVPKILLRFDNPKTGGGTGKAYDLVQFSTLLAEIESIRGVGSAFVEILNFREEVVELISDDEAVYTWICNRDDATRERVNPTALEKRLWSFLTK